MRYVYYAALVCLISLSSVLFHLGPGVAQEPPKPEQQGPITEERPEVPEAKPKQQGPVTEERPEVPEVLVPPVVVTATRTERSVTDLPVSATVVTRKDVSDAPIVGTDDLMQQIPSVQLPYMDSFSQHPTANFMGMRGLGQPRALVLIDGVPLNDPFFGYVQWNMVPKETIERIEVVRGGSSSLWGNYAMGGVINVITKNAQPTQFGQSLMGGSYGTIRSNSYGSYRTIDNHFGISANVNYQQTDGYIPQEPNQRGATDIPASNANTNLQFKSDYTSPDFKWYARGNLYNSTENTGQSLSDNLQDTLIFNTGATWKLTQQEDLQAAFFYWQQNFTTNNPSNINCCNGPIDRNSVFLSNLHQTPVTSVGGYTQYERRFNETFRSAQVGVDLRWVQGTDNSQLYSAPGASPTTLNGSGKQLFAGLFGQTSIVPMPKLELLPSVRMDYYENYAGNMQTSGPGTSLTTTNFSPTSNIQVNPKLATRYQITEPLAIRAAVYRAFRAPTLDNLYRNFQSPGFNLVSNPFLAPETMVGGDAGLELNVSRFQGQLNLFWSDVKHAITSLPVPGTQFFQIENAGTIQSRGVELMGEVQLWQDWSALFGFVYTDSKLISTSASSFQQINGSFFVGSRTPGVPMYFETVSLRYRKPEGLDFVIRMRANQYIFAIQDGFSRLSDQLIFDVNASYPIRKNISVFLIGTNITNEQYQASFTGSPIFGSNNTIGAPVMVFGGVSFTLGNL